MHIGNRIQEVLIQQGMTIPQLAEQVACDRSNMYKILKRRNMDTELISKISKILNHNFFEDLAQDLENDKQSI